MSRLFARITKVDEETRTVTGRAAQEVVDKDNEIFHYESSKPNFMKWSSEVHADSNGASMGNIRAMHGNVCAGKMTDIEFNDAEKAIDIEAKIVDDNEWKKILEGCYTGFSIGGKYTKKWPSSINGKMVYYYTADPSEISIVDRPCNPTAKFFTVHKSDGTEALVKFQSIEKGDSPGHEFHGNQYNGGNGSRAKNKVERDHANAAVHSAYAAHDAAQGTPEEAASTRAMDATSGAVHSTSSSPSVRASLHDAAADQHAAAASAHYKLGDAQVSRAHGNAAYSHRNAAAYLRAHYGKSDSGGLHKDEGVEKDWAMPAGPTTGVSNYDQEGARTKKRRLNARRGSENSRRAPRDDLYDAEPGEEDVETQERKPPPSRRDAARSVSKGDNLRKSISDVCTLVSIANTVSWMACQEAVERAREGDESTLPEGLKDAAVCLLSLVSDMADEESKELNSFEFPSGEVLPDFDDDDFAEPKESVSWPKRWKEF